jgi:hypothetical protein
MWKRDSSNSDDHDFKFLTDAMPHRACTYQGMVVKMDDDTKNNACLETAWMLLDESEQRRHLLNGIKDACDEAAFGPDARALSPEVTTSAMMKQNGKAFIDFARNLAKAIREADPDQKPYLLLSDWWRSAIQEPEPWSDDTKFAFSQLSFQRNEYICESIDFSKKKKCVRCSSLPSYIHLQNSDVDFA